MDFGRLDNIAPVDFSLPAQHPDTARVLRPYKGAGNPKLHIGCPVWGEKDWVGKIYPKGTKPKEFLHYYATQFNCVELNATHYNMPSEILVEKWKADVPATFKFCPKIPQLISHVQGLENCQDITGEFCRVIDQLGDNLGTCFLQLPPNFDPGRAGILFRFLEDFPRTTPLVAELRHPAWFKDKTLADELFAVMEKNNIGSVITDVAGRRDVMHLRLSTPTAFVRFGANDLHPTDYQRIQQWVQQLQRWIEEGLQQVYFFTHTLHRHYNLELVTYTIETLNQLGYNLKAPYSYKDVPKPNPQGSLF